MDKKTPVFEALSYTWVSTVDPLQIKFGPSGNTTLAVTQNLGCALPYLRYKDKPRVLWIDAVCIDQQNLEERNQQVQRMVDIYRLANRVVAWLSPAENDSAYALKILNYLSSKITIDWENFTMKPATQEESDTQWSDETKDLPYRKQEAAFLCHLFNRSWFESL